MSRVAAKFMPKLLNFDQKRHRVNVAQEMLDTVHYDSNVLQNWWQIMGEVKTKAQSMEAAVWAKIEKSAPNSIECEGFFKIVEAWSIMSSCQRVVWSISNITCKLCAIYAK